tara:strand:+ start:1195 stop:1416 length:222 start_codon:yes stop_codon:yes gene_type:complete
MKEEDNQINQRARFDCNQIAKLLDDRKDDDTHLILMVNMARLSDMLPEKVDLEVEIIVADFKKTLIAALEAAE